MSTKKRKKINSRDKGCRGEREWAAMLSKYGFESRRGAQNGVLSGMDVQGDVPGWRGEVKNRAKADWPKWMYEANEDAERFGLRPYVAWKRLGARVEKWRVRCFASDLWRVADPTVIEMDGEDFLRTLIPQSS